MARGEIVIDQENCQGCGFCVRFCSRGCIEMSNQLNRRGYLMARFVNQERCNACTVCAWLCPAHLIEVYRYVEKAS